MFVLKSVHGNCTGKGPYGARMVHIRHIKILLLINILPVRAPKRLLCRPHNHHKGAARPPYGPNTENVKIEPLETRDYSPKGQTNVI